MVAVSLGSSGHAGCSFSPGGGGEGTPWTVTTCARGWITLWWPRTKFPWSPPGSPRDGKIRKQQTTSALYRGHRVEILRVSRSAWGSVLLVKEVGRTIARDGTSRNLSRECWTEPWRVSVLVQPGLSYTAMLGGRRVRKKVMPTANAKVFYGRSQRRRRGSGITSCRRGH